MGAVFSEPITGGTPTLLASLDGTDGSSPTAGLILSGNTLYGTAIEGGVGSEDGIANNGTVFSVPSGGGTPTVLTNFNFVDGSGPEAALTLSGSTLYGTTYSGGYGYGEVFSLPLSGGTPTVLTSFNGTVNALGGINPSSGLIISGNKLYGTAGGGPNGGGEIFSLPITGGTPTILTSFIDSTEGQEPGGLVLSGNTFYGTTIYGATQSGNPFSSLYGEIFSVPVTGGTPTVLISFDTATGDDFASGTLIDVGGNLYDTTHYGGPGEAIDGTVFEFTPPSTTLAAPTDVTASQGTPTHHVAITWAAVSGAASYQVYRSTDNNFSDAIKIAGGITGDSYNDATTIPATLYYYWVCARNSQMIGPASASASGYIPLAAPTGVSATTNLAHHVAVTWNPVAGAASYQVFRSTTDDFSTAVRIATGLTATFFNDTTAVLGDSYFYWVRAKNTVSVGLPSTSVVGSLG